MNTLELWKDAAKQIGIATFTVATQNEVTREYKARKGRRHSMVNGFYDSDKHEVFTTPFGDTFKHELFHAFYRTLPIQDRLKLFKFGKLLFRSKRRNEISIIYFSVPFNDLTTHHQMYIIEECWAYHVMEYNPSDYYNIAVMFARLFYPKKINEFLNKTRYI